MGRPRVQRAAEEEAAVRQRKREGDRAMRRDGLTARRDVRAVWLGPPPREGEGKRGEGKRTPEIVLRIHKSTV